VAGLRRALRLSKSAFAGRLGITPRSVKNWEDGARIAAFSEELLDSLLAGASDEAQQRFVGELLESASLDDLLGVAAAHAALAPSRPDPDRSPGHEDSSAAALPTLLNGSNGRGLPDDWRGAMAAALTRHRSALDGEPLPENALLAAVAVAKSQYQRCSYRDVTMGLPDLVVQLAAALAVSGGASRLWIAAAEAYQVAARVLLKFDDCGLAVLAADRSMSAAVAGGRGATALELEWLRRATT
jgi:hypothetical protein